MLGKGKQVAEYEQRDNDENNNQVPSPANAMRLDVPIGPANFADTTRVNALHGLNPLVAAAVDSSPTANEQENQIHCTRQRVSGHRSVF